jgi:hypothetical protein
MDLDPSIIELGGKRFLERGMKRLRTVVATTAFVIMAGKSLAYDPFRNVLNAHCPTNDGYQTSWRDYFGPGTTWRWRQRW